MPPITAINSIGIGNRDFLAMRGLRNSLLQIMVMISTAERMTAVGFESATLEKRSIRLWKREKWYYLWEKLIKTLSLSLNSHKQF